MNAIELKCARIRHRKSTKEMAQVIGKSVGAYTLRERGVSPVTLEEACLLGPALGLSEKEFLTIFCDGIVPYRKEAAGRAPDSGDIVPPEGAD